MSRTCVSGSWLLSLLRQENRNKEQSIAKVEKNPKTLVEFVSGPPG